MTALCLKPHETLRALVRLPKLLTEHSPANNKLSVAGAGLLGDGDQVVIAGFSGGIPNSDSSLKYIREECRAHVAFFAAIMTSPADYAATVPLAGLFPFGTKSSLIDIGSDGILVIEPPCIYFEDARDFDIDETSDPPHVRYFLKLARPLVRFNKSDNLLWMGEHGPMTSGDWVTIGPGEHRGDDEGENVYSGNIYEDECFTEHETSAAWMHPRWMSPLTR